MKLWYLILLKSSHRINWRILLATEIYGTDNVAGTITKLKGTLFVSLVCTVLLQYIELTVSRILNCSPVFPIALRHLILYLKYVGIA